MVRFYISYLWIDFIPDLYYNIHNQYKGGILVTKIAERLKEIRVAHRYSQKQIADMCGMAQATIGRYETDAADPSPETLLWYAETFEVSLDYIYGRTDNPQGRLYEHKTKYSPEMEKFVEMCFDPNSRANHQLKATLLKLLSSEGVTDD